MLTVIVIYDLSNKSCEHMSFAKAVVTVIHFIHYLFSYELVTQNVHWKL